MKYIIKIRVNVNRKTLTPLCLIESIVQKKKVNIFWNSNNFHGNYKAVYSGRRNKY